MSYVLLFFVLAMLACTLSCSDEPVDQDDSSSEQTAGTEPVDASEASESGSPNEDDADPVETDDTDGPCTCPELAAKLAAIELKVQALEQRSPGLGAYDGAGNYLGQTSGRGSVTDLIVLAFHPEFMFPLLISENGSVAVRDVAFASADCSGTPYIVTNPTSMVGEDNEGNLYVPVQGQLANSQYLKSRLGPDKASCAAMPFPEEPYSVWQAEKAIPPFPYPISGPISVK